MTVAPMLNRTAATASVFDFGSSPPFATGLLKLARPKFFTGLLSHHLLRPLTATATGTAARSAPIACSSALPSVQLRIMSVLAPLRIRSRPLPLLLLLLLLVVVSRCCSSNSWSCRCSAADAAAAAIADVFCHVVVEVAAAAASGGGGGGVAFL